MKKRRSGQNFWDKEYKQAAHLALSSDPSEDLVAFTRWLEREYGKKYLNPIVSVVDLGCGNGRNLTYLSESYGMRGVGYDIAGVAIAQARSVSADLPLQYEVRSIAPPLPLPDASQTLVLDMMSSHILTSEERAALVVEIARVLRPDGWLFMKTFLLDEDRNAARMLREHPGDEEGTYIHPKIGVAEHVFTEEELTDALSPYFAVQKIVKSHRHKESAGGKRRTISVYAQKV